MPLALVPTENAFLKEEKTVKKKANRYKCIIRTRHSGRAHRGAACLVKTGKLTSHTPGGRSGVSLMRRSPQLEAGRKPFMPGSSSHLCSPLANYLVSFFTPDLPDNPPQHICAALFQDGFQPRGLRGPWHAYYGMYSLFWGMQKPSMYVGSPLP